MQKDEIKMKLDVAFNQNPLVGPSKATLCLDESDARRLLANIKFVTDNEKRADQSRDEINSVDFMCAAAVDFHGADDTFAPAGLMFRCYSGGFCLSFYDDDCPDNYETQMVNVKRVERAMKKKGWL